MAVKPRTLGTAMGHAPALYTWSRQVDVRPDRDLGFQAPRGAAAAPWAARSHRQRSRLLAPVAAPAGMCRRLQVTVLCQRHQLEVSVPGHWGCILLTPAWRVLRNPPPALQNAWSGATGLPLRNPRTGEHQTITCKNTSGAWVGWVPSQKCPLPPSPLAPPPVCSPAEGRPEVLSCPHWGKTTLG